MWCNGMQQIRKLYWCNPHALPTALHRSSFHPDLTLPRTLLSTLYRAPPSVSITAMMDLSPATCAPFLPLPLTTLSRRLHLGLTWKLRDSWFAQIYIVFKIKFLKSKLKISRVRVLGYCTADLRNMGGENSCTVIKKIVKLAHLFLSRLIYFLTWKSTFLTAFSPFTTGCSGERQTRHKRFEWTSISCGQTLASSSAEEVSLSLVR